MGSIEKIPKIIHYCWFGGNPLPDMAKRCIESWKKYCPDYEIVEWNEQNFEINFNAYVKEAYEAKKWAFVSDVARLYALVNFGGVYMDTDVEVIKSLDDLLVYEAVSGFETPERIPTGLMACVKNQKMFEELLFDYQFEHFIREDGSMNLTTNVTRITNYCLKYGLELNNEKQCINGFTLLPRDYLCPKDVDTSILELTENSYTIHHFDGSWHSEEDIFVEKMSRSLTLPGGNYVAKCIGVVKYRGMCAAVKETIGWIKRKFS